MSHTVLVIIALVLAHWVADFVMQSDKMAINKSKKHWVLGAHCLVYSLCLSVFGWEYSAVNGVAHFAVDAVSSRATSYLYAKGDRHNFFVVIGLDQAIHLIVLIVTAQYFGLL